MIRGLFAVGIAAGLALATLPVEVAARGFGAHTAHAVGPIFFRGSPVHHHHRAFDYGPYGGIVATYAPGGELVGDVSTPQTMDPVIPASFVLSCHHSQEIKTVPSEEGGTRQITITRC
jgi:hypothetical protein